MKTTSLKSLLAVLGAGFTLGLSTHPLPADDDVAANYVVTVADDFVVDIYHNGRVVPDDHRHVLIERFGATSERIDLPVNHGDWLVFHVVNDRLRWGGVSYFAAAGLIEKGDFGFVSMLCSGDWSACDNPARAPRFISRKNFMSDCPARKITQPWAEGEGYMKQFAGDSWSGEPLWGCRSDTWLKFIVP